MSYARTTTAIIAIFIYACLKRIYQRNMKKRDRNIALIFSVFFAIMQIVGKSFAENNSLDAIFLSKFVFIRAIVVMVGFWVVGYIAIIYIQEILDKHTTESKLSKSINKKKLILFYLICWLPYYCLFFPGTANADTSIQLTQYFHIPTWVLKLSSITGDNIFATNHHPYFLTLLYGCFCELGVNMGNIKYGIAIYSILQMILMAVVLTNMWTYLCTYRISYKFIKAGILLSAFIPIVPLFSICMVKDTLFSMVCLVLLMELFEIARSKGSILKNKKYAIITFFTCILFTLTKNQGIYFLSIIFFLSILIYRKYRKQLLFVIFIPILFNLVIWNNIFLPCWNVAPGGRQEALGFLFQQTARYVTEYESEVTNEEIEIISKVLDYDNLVNNYTPTSQDKVKFTFNQKVNSEELRQYFKVWWCMFLKHPVVYIEATLNTCYGYFLIDRNATLAYYEFSNRVDENSIAYVEKSELTEISQHYCKNLLNVLQRILIINLTLTLAVYVWVNLYFVCEMIRQEKYQFLYPGILPMLSIGILLLSPVNGNIRYVLPIFFMSFFLIGICFEKEDEMKGENDGQNRSINTMLQRIKNN